jgi:hypothetical protein
MSGVKEAELKNQISTEIELLQKNYQTLNFYLSGAEYDKAQVVEVLKSFKNGLDRMSTHILTLYMLKGQKTKITWEQLLNNLEIALQTMTSSKSNPISAINIAFTMSEPNVQEVMTYIATLKESLH